MRNLLIILFSFFIASCTTIYKGQKGKNEGHGSDNGGSAHKDSITINISDTIPSDDIMGESAEMESQHVILTSGEEWHPANPNMNPKHKLNIVVIRNGNPITTSTDVSEGRVVYGIPERMKIRSTYRVFLRISKSKTTIRIYDSLQGTIRTSVIAVTQTMEISLVDPSPADNKSFEVVPDNNGIQIVDSGETFTEWTWNVTPIRTGKYDLKIVVSTLRNGNKKDKVYEDTVKVDVDLPAQALFFWSKWWQWIIGFVSPFFIWLYKRRKEKKDKA